MPSGKTHDALTAWLTLPVFLLCLWFLKLDLWASLMACLGFWFGGIYLSPDLDTRSRAFYRWGFFRFIWWPYQWLVRHRSRLSHGIFTGTLFRLAYFSAVLVLAWFVLRYSLGHVPGPWIPRQEVITFINASLPDLLALGAGIWGGALLHILLDTFGGWFRLPRL